MKRIVIVTGSKSGVGRQLCMDLLQNDYAVVGFDRNTDGLSLPWPLISCDMADPQSIEFAFNDAVTKFGTPYGLVNNAGVYFAKSWDEQSIEEYDQTIAINARGPYWLSRCFGKKLVDASEPGVIVNISSISAKIGSVDVGYAASKAALTASAKSLAKAYAPLGIRVVTVSPGPVETDMAKRIPPDRKKAYQEGIPLKRFAEAKEVSALVLFLLSENASYITGADYQVDGGLT